MTAPDHIWCHPTERQHVPAKERGNAKWVLVRWKDHDSKASGDVEYIRADLASAALPERGVSTDCRKWFYYPIEMPLTVEGNGPAILGRDSINKITYEVWDRELNSHASFDNLPDAINEAMRLNLNV